MATNVTVITGPARCGKTHALLCAYRAVWSEPGGPTPRLGTTRLAPQLRALWIAPTARAAETVREQLLAGGLAACLSPGVVTFDQLSERVLAQGAGPACGGAAVHRLTAATERELMRRVVARVLKAGGLKHFADAAARASFIDLLVDHVRELKRHGVGPAEFAKAVPSRRAAEQHRELAALYRRYERLLARHGLSDTEGRHGAARDALASERCQWPPQLRLVVADGFTDFTPTQQEILRHLARRTERMMIALPGDEAEPVRTGRSSVPSRSEAAGGPLWRSDLFAKTEATLAALRRSLPNLNVERMPHRPTGWPALDHLARHLFRNPNQVPCFEKGVRNRFIDEKVPDTFFVIAAAGTQDEIVQLARRIKRRLLDGTRPGDIVVVFRTLGDAAPRVREVFTEFGIPFALESGVPLMRAAVLRSLMSLLRLEVDDWPFRQVVAVLTNNTLAALGGANRARADWLVRDLQIAQGRRVLAERVEQLAAEAAELAESSSARGDHFERRAQAARVALPLVQRLGAALDALPREATLAEWTAALAEMGARLGLAPFVAAGDAGATCEDPESALASDMLGPRAAGPAGSMADESAMLAQWIDRVAWEAIVRHLAAIERLDEWLGQSPRRLSRRELLALLVDLASHESLPRPHDEVGRVRVLAAATARTVTARHVYLAGMSEQAFPSPERAGRLYSAAEYRHFAATGSSPAGRAQEEMLLFYEVLTRATESLTISYPALDARAQALPPSPYVTEVERTLGRENFCRSGPRLSPVPGEAVPYSPAEWRIHAVARALDGDGRLLAGLFAGGGRESFARSIDAGLRTVHFRSRRDRFSPMEGLLTSAAVRGRLAKRFGPEHVWSPSQWETYAACPYRFFLESILGLEPLGELVLESDHARRGSLLHRVMATFHRELRVAMEDGGAPSRQQRAELSAKFTATLDGAIRSTSTGGVEAALAELDRRQIAKWGERYFEQLEKYDAAWTSFDEPLAPAHFEVRFGPPRPGESDEDPRSTDRPFTLEVGGEQIRITGRIDRIDVGRIGERVVFNVIDYKSGRRPALKDEHILSGQQLQLPLYVVAAQTVLFAGEEAAPLVAGYWSMASGCDARRSLQVHQHTADGVAASEKWETLWPAVVERIGQFVADIRRGNFPVYSANDDCTKRCDFRTVCRVNHVRSLGKTWPEESGEA